MEDKKSLIVYKENIFTKIKKFFINIFSKRNKELEFVVETVPNESYIGNTKNKFNEYISFKENKEELNLINSVRNNLNILQNMSMDELNKVEDAIKNRQNFVNKKISKLKTDLMMKKKVI